MALENQRFFGRLPVFAVRMEAKFSGMAKMLPTIAPAMAPVSHGRAIKPH
jgi:hypothetical protein